MDNPFTEIEKKLASIDAKVSLLTRFREQETKPKNERFLTIDETCRLLSVTRPTLWSWDKKGILESIRIGNLRRYRISDIENLAAKQLDKKQGNE